MFEEFYEMYEPEEEVVALINLCIGGVIADNSLIKGVESALYAFLHRFRTRSWRIHLSEE